MTGVRHKENGLAEELSKAKQRIAELEEIEARHELATRELGLFRKLIDQSNDMIFVIDPGTWDFVDVNDRACEKLGYSRQELLGMKLFNVTTVLTPETIPWYYKELKARGFLVFEKKPRRKDGTTFLVEASIRYVVVGEMEYVVGILRDITERKQAEEELGKYRIGLEELVAERTAELKEANLMLQQGIIRLHRAEEKLRQYARELERSNRELEQFAFVASHDLQEPLLAMASNLKLFERRYRDRLSPGDAGFVTNAIEGAIRMQALIRHLLAYSRASTGGGAFEKIEAASAVGLALENLAGRVEESGAVITYDPLPEVTADPVQLAQLFQNLIGNAIKFRGDQTPRIHISATRAEDTHWVFAVRDNGIGIPSEQLERIFEVFHRAHDKKQYSGSGIGLATCKKIVERHGGRIWAESEPGGGSAFYFTLPFVIPWLEENP